MIELRRRAKNEGIEKIENGGTKKWRLWKMTEVEYDN